MPNPQLCDAIADGVLDACLAMDSTASCLVRVAAKNNNIILLGSVHLHTAERPDLEQVVRDVMSLVGFDSEDKGCDYHSVEITNYIDVKSSNPETPHLGPDPIPGGQCGTLFAYATDESPELMPLTHLLATRLSLRLEEVRKQGIVSGLRPDGKTQVSIEYKRLPSGALKPLRIHTVVISAQHEPLVEVEALRGQLMEHVVNAVIPQALVDKETLFHMNKSSRFVIGGPMADAGLTGRKIIVDTYGGWCPSSGACFSGTDPKRVARCGAYGLRTVARSLVAAGLCHRCTIHTAYTPGPSCDPISILVDSHQSIIKEGLTDSDLANIVRRSFDLTPSGMTRWLRLDKGLPLRDTATHGHFGHIGGIYTWEVQMPLTVE
ncbi:S-adenosylmethionine synthetase [Kipferlia bialata]|uniref:S-adenosylmethionine synthase n=1 Tax=Kipferlia bialata TaxID=797122 RepID=A0A9K3CR48_9EUKA|nr:S-adenosylmethionine synthetase [Kipferlia bialata]|eukprot:g2652.t1